MSSFESFDDDKSIGLDLRKSVTVINSSRFRRGLTLDYGRAVPGRPAVRRGFYFLGVTG